MVHYGAPKPLCLSMVLATLHLSQACEKLLLWFGDGFSWFRQDGKKGPIQFPGLPAILSFIELVVLK